MYLGVGVLASMEVLALRMAPAWLLNSHLDVEELEMVLQALFLLAELDQELVEGDPC